MNLEEVARLIPEMARQVNADHRRDIMHRRQALHHAAEKLGGGSLAILGGGAAIPNSDLVDLDVPDGLRLEGDQLLHLLDDEHLRRGVGDGDDALLYGVECHLVEKQIEAQRGFVQARKLKNPVANSIRVSTRIKMGEFGILIAGISMIVLLGALLYFNYVGEIEAGNVVVLFLGLRMQNSNLSGISTGLMRFARARTHSE